jgi:hypothetical protein
MKFKDITESSQKCPHCGGPLVEYSGLMEKKDACYYKVKASAKVWPSAYASGRLVQCRKKGAANYGNKSESVAEGLNEFAPGSRDNDGNDGFSNDTLRQLAAQWYNGDEDPRVEQTLMAAGWEIGQDEGYDDTPGVFVVQAGDINGRSYISWPAHELEGLSEGADPASAKFGKYIKKYFDQIYEYGDDGLNYLDNNAPFWASLFDKHNGDIDDIIAMEPADVLTQAALELKDVAGDLKYELDEQGVAEEYNPEYDDEAGMADNNLETLARAVEGIDDLIQTGDNLPEWCQEKIAVAKSMLVAVWDYMYSEEASDEVDPEIDAMFEAMDQLVHETAHAQQLSVDLVWESFEALDDHMLYETAAWRRKEGKSKKGGLNAKGVASYRRENPGSKLQMAVTTKPSKLKKGSKASKRRKSFCARMGGVKGPMKKPNGKPTRKALALRKWNC